jgi:hypothetical protein
MSAASLRRLVSTAGPMALAVVAAPVLAQDLTLFNSVPAPAGGQTYSLPVQTLLFSRRWHSCPRCCC